MNAAGLWFRFLLSGIVFLTSAMVGFPAERVVRREVFFAEGYQLVPLRRTANHHWYLSGKVDGRRRSCLVDSGWSFATLSTNTAGLSTNATAVRELRLDGVVLTNQSFVVSDLRSENQPTSYDLVLGLDFLTRHQAVLDCGNNRLFLRRETALVASRNFETNLVAGGWRCIRLDRYEPPALVVPVAVAGSESRWLVDSGAAWTCIDASVATQLGIKSRPSLHRISGPAAGLRNVFVTELLDWHLGNERQQDASVAVMSLKSLGLGPQGKLFPQVTGILGGADLFSRRAYIDFGAQKLWLQTPRRSR